MEEVVREVFAEIGGNPGTFAIEVVQFLVLVAIVYFFAFGLGRRKGMVTNMLAERRGRVEARVEVAAHAQERLEDARAKAAARVEAARAEAAGILKDARATARSQAKKTRATTDAEAVEMRERAARALEDEREQMHIEMRDRLVGVVAQSTRTLLNEGLTPQEQRQLIQELVASQVETLEESVGQLSAAAAQ